MTTETPPVDTAPAGRAATTRRWRRDDGGIVIVYFALAIFVVMGMAAFVVDLGYWYYQSARIQRAADAASLAGVVYMPGNPGEATTVATNVATDNGFGPGPNDTVQVVAIPGQPDELKVTIKDSSVPTFFAKAFGMKTIAETRTATAAYDPSIPLGSPENSFGTGSLPFTSAGAGACPSGAAPSCANPSNIWAAINGYCTAKENGDEFASAWDGTWNGSSWVCPPWSTASTVVANYEYDPHGYYYDIQAPTNGQLTVQAYDPAYEPTCAGSPDNPPLIGGATITTNYSLWYAPVPLDHSQDSQIGSTISFPTNGPGCNAWTNLFTFNATAGAEYRVQVQTLAGQQNSDGNNSYALRVFYGTMSTSFTRCSTVSTGASKTWYSSTCPTISGDTALSVYANQASATGSFYLAQINPAYANHTMEINLFDPGEGSKYIQVINPDTGAPMPFTYSTTDATASPSSTWGSDCGSDCATSLGFPSTEISGNSDGSSPPSLPTSGSPGLPVSGTITPPRDELSNSVFNDRHVQLTVKIPANYQALNGGWWQIQYTATSQITDRTTWSVQILGDPVHLVQ